MNRLWLFLLFLVLLSLNSGISSPPSQADRQSLEPNSSGKAAQAGLTVTFQIDVNAEPKPISLWIYGINRLPEEPGIWAAARMGGNRWTGYNWENNASNAGSDWYHSNDDFLCWILSCEDGSQPAAALKTFLDEFGQVEGQYALLTLPMAGFVAADKDGPVAENQTAPSVRWEEIKYQKSSAFDYSPDLTDQVVYVDELVAHLVQTYGQAASAQVRRGYSLDNEPDLWKYTHSRLHPSQTTVAELIDKSAALASAVKKVDPQAEIFAPVHYGFWGMKTLQDAPDWLPYSQTYDWFVDVYLDQMRRRSEQTGKRLLDVFDFHWYPEAQGCGQRILWSGVGDECLQRARMQAPRALWDESFEEDSWIGEWFGDYLPILPRLRTSIQTYYPGTKLAMTEFSYGAENHISGGIAIADVLGVLGKYGVSYAYFYPLEQNFDYVTAAYRIYRNYDGQGSAFGNFGVRAETSNVEVAPIYAAIHDLDVSRLHLIVINRDLTQSVQGNFVITSPVAYTQIKGWKFDQADSQIRAFSVPGNIQDNQFDYTIPPLTVVHFVIESQAQVPIYKLFLPLTQFDYP
jgi:mannan endo-1,4-beta-mannosidase